MARRSGRTSDDDDFGDDNDEDDDEERDSEDAGAAAKAVRAPPQPPAAFPMSVVTKAVVLAEQVPPPPPPPVLPSPAFACQLLTSPVIVRHATAASRRCDNDGARREGILFGARDGRGDEAAVRRKGGAGDISRHAGVEGRLAR